MADAEPLDHETLLAEIEAEARRRRDHGDLPADLERELDLVFARYAPPAAVAHDLEALIEAAERSVFVDINAPVDSVRPGVPQLKRAISKATAFQLRHLAQQTGSMGHALLLLARSLVERVEALEALDPASSDPVTRLRRRLPPGEAPLPLDAVIAAVRSVEGRVVVLGAGGGAAVTALRDAGHDAYGIEADDRLLTGADDVHVRAGDPTTHLDGVAPDVLAGIVLAPPPGPVARQLAVVDAAARALGPSGVLVVVVEGVDAWAARVGPVAVDLAGGRPLHAETWALACGTGSFDTVETRPAGQGVDLVRAVRPER